MTTMTKYLPRTVEYPGESIIDDPLPLGVFHAYVPSTLLFGFVNHAKPQMGFVLSSYRMWFNPVPQSTMQVQDPPGSFNWVTKDVASKQEEFDLATEPGRLVTFDPYAFWDDVLLLSRTSTFTWILFWFDPDVSDCAIGRFVTEDEPDVVLAAFRNYATTMNNRRLSSSLGSQMREIPIDVLSRPTFA